MSSQKINQQRITLVAGIILVVATLLVSVAVFIVMQRHTAEVQLSKSLQSALQNGVQRTQAEISAGFDRAMLIASRPLLIDQIQRVNANTSGDAARRAVNKAAQALLPTGLTSIALFDKNGRELARAGTFIKKSALTVPLDFPGRVQLMWDGQLLLHAVVEMKQTGHVVGKVMTEMSLPATMSAFKDASRLGKTGDLALCAPLGPKMQCFPTTRYPHVLTLSQRLPKGNLLPMAHALTGETGFVTSRDYRQHEVVAAYAPVGNLGLGMELKLDRAELYAPVWNQLRYLIPLLLVVFIIVQLLLRWLLFPLVARLVRSEAETLRFKNVIDCTLDMIFMFDPESLRFVYLNQGAVLNMGYSREELLEMMPYQLRSLMSEPEFRQLIAPLLSGEQASLHHETVYRRKDGTVFPVDTSLQLVRDSDGSRLFVAVVRDITERKKTEDALQLAAMVYQNSSESMTVADSKGAIISINPAFTKVTGYTLEDVIGRNSSILSSGRHERSFYQSMWNEINTTGHWRGEIWNRHKNGELYLEWLTINTIYHDDGSINRYVALFSDITQKKASEDLIWQQANFDTLTGLPNRHMFYDKLVQGIKKSHLANLSMALLFIDLDNFKEVNDTMGHNMGDLLLIEAARRIGDCVRESDTVARLGGDEFTVILSGIRDLNRVNVIAQNIITRLAAPFQLLQETGFVSASIGITLYPNDARDIDTLMKNADQAMYSSKKSGRGCFNYFTLDLRKVAQLDTRLGNDLRNALPGKQLTVYYQPIVELATGKLCKAEALLRWQHPELGMVSPMQFIPLAEKSGLIHEIGDWVFREAARELKRWRAMFAPGFQISVNVSPVQFRHGWGDGESSWLGQLRAMDLPGQGLVIEITEGVLLNAEINVTKQLLSFRDFGVQVALDDFGTGYSSLAYLKTFNIDYIKIDQSFVRNLENDPDDIALCEAIIVMAHKLGLKVIAEGVETGQQRDLLTTYGCDYAQGYLYSRPVPSEEFEALLSKMST